jgi:hypothetical protein
MRALVKKALFAIPGLVVTAFVFLASVSPDNASSNLAKWAEKARVRSWPPWLLERRAVVTSIVLVVAFYLWLWGHGQWTVRLSRLKAGISKLSLLRLRSPLTFASPRTPAVIRSYEDLQEIQELRTLWNRYFQPAARTCQTIFGSVLARLETKYWWRLANPPLERLHKASMRMAEAVDDNTLHGLQEVQASQNEVYGAYWGGASG